MSRSAWLVCLVLVVPAAAFAEGKCGDAPYKMPDGKLVVTWVLPVPAAVQEVDNSEFQSAGGEMHPALPSRHQKNRKTVALREAQSVLATTVSDLEAWENQYGIAITPGARPLLQAYVDAGFKLHGTLVEHPDVAPAQPDTFKSCTCVNQRGIVYHDGNTESLYVRSWFHSARDGSSYQNFAPAGGLKVAFARNKIWFPLRFAKVAQESNTYLVLDLLTTKSIPLGWIPKMFTAKARPQRVVDGKTWQVLRLTAVLPRGSDTPDLELPLP